MEFIENFPFFSIVLSLLCAALSFAFKERGARRINTCLVILVMVLSASTLIYNISTGVSFTYKMGHFPAPWGNEIRAGIIEPLFALLFGGIMLATLAGGYSRLQLDIVDDKRRFYYIMLDLVQAALMAMIYTNDLFTGYVFIEICTIASCGILMISETGKSLVAATRYMIFSLLGSSLFLIGVILLYDITGHLLMENIATSVRELWATGNYTIPLTVTIGLMVVGLSIKGGLFPFHFWMPDTYGSGTPASSGILSGIISKIYIFLLIKVIYRVIGFDIFVQTNVQNVLFVLGICAIIIGSLSAIRENDINRMIAYSSAAQIGYIFMGIGLGTTAGMIAALFHIVTHALTKPSLFVSAAQLCDVSGGSQKFVDLQGSAHRNKAAGAAFTIGAMSMVGLPGFVGFVSKLLFATAAIGIGWKMLPTLIALAVSTVLNTLYFLRTVLRIYTPGGESKQKRTPKTQLLFIAASLGFICVNIYFGLHSQPIVSLIEKGIALFK